MKNSNNIVCLLLTGITVLPTHEVASWQLKTSGYEISKVKYSIFDEGLKENQGYYFPEYAPTDQALYGTKRVEYSKKLIDTDTPVAVSVDVFPLAQVGLFPRHHHAGHQYIAAGYDGDEGTVHLIDPSPWQPSTRSIPLDLFLACWDTSAIPGEGQEPHNWTWLEVPARQPSLSSRQVSAILQRNCKSMSASKDQEHLFVGLKGIEQLAEDSGAWVVCEKSLLKAHLRRCAEQLLEIALLREGHGHFLRHISPVCDRPGLVALGREFRTISQSWFVVKNLCFKGAVKETDSVVPRIQARLRGIAARERIALATLTEVMGL